MGILCIVQENIKNMSSVWICQQLYRDILQICFGAHNPLFKNGTSVEIHWQKKFSELECSTSF